MLPVERFNHFIKQHLLFTTADSVLAAVSGGRDSILLAHLLKHAGYSFGIAHCNFQLRGAESDMEQTFTKNLAEQLKVPFYTTNLDILQYAEQEHISIQMAARNLRYQWFEEIRGQFNYSKIAVAHHQNDSIETILLNLTRGTGIAGLHGILPVQGFIVRPMLFLTREEIDTISEDSKLEYLDDSSNFSAKYARNKLRLEVIPKLKELNPNLEQTFDNNIKRFRELETLLINRLTQLKSELFIESAEEICIPIEKIKSLDPQSLLLFGLLSPYGFNETVVDDVITSLNKHSGRIFECAGYSLLLDRGQLILTKNKKTDSLSILIYPDVTAVKYKKYKLTLIHDDSAMIVKGNPMTFSADHGKLIFPLTLRSWNEGDYFYPLGMNGKKKLSDYFTGEKIPLNQKNEIPVLVNGNDEIIWVAGMRPDERYKVSTRTKKVVIFELYKLTV